jgi:hypothetical protein
LVSSAKATIVSALLVFVNSSASAQMPMDWCDSTASAILRSVERMKAAADEIKREWRSWYDDPRTLPESIRTAYREEANRTIGKSVDSITMEQVIDQMFKDQYDEKIAAVLAENERKALAPYGNTIEEYNKWCQRYRGPLSLD